MAIHKDVTEAVREANRSNGEKGAGPATEAGKAQSRHNALKHGKYAERPDPVALILAGPSAEEEAERAQLRAEVVRCYGPGDDFARMQAEELADLKFEMVRLDRVKQVIRARERELLEVEQMRRGRRIQNNGVGAGHRWVEESGLCRLPESAAKFQEMIGRLQWVKDYLAQKKYSAARKQLGVIYGTQDMTWRGSRIWDLLPEDDGEEPSEEAGKYVAMLLELEMEAAEERLLIYQGEHEPLTPAGQAAHLLEAMNSRKWAWIRHQENTLRRSIDRKVRILMELRREHARVERESQRGHGGLGAGAEDVAGTGATAGTEAEDGLEGPGASGQAVDPVVDDEPEVPEQADEAVELAQSGEDALGDETIPTDGGDLEGSGEATSEGEVLPGPEVPGDAKNGPETRNEPINPLKISEGSNPVEGDPGTPADAKTGGAERV